jgi:hypothetical protein
LVDRGENVEVKIDPSGRTVLAVLNEISKVAQAHPWFVTTTGDAVPVILSYGALHRDGNANQISIRYDSK